MNSEEYSDSSDQLLFSVSDSSMPPNTLSDQSFIIDVDSSETADEDKNADMQLTPGVELGITVSSLITYVFF